MKKIIFCVILSVVFFTGPIFAANSELTLQEAFQRSLMRSESVAITGEEMAQAQARFYRSFDYFVPTAHFEVTRTWQDTRGGSTSSEVASDAQRQMTPQKKFVFSQPIFSGFKELAALQGAGADKKQQAYALKRAKELLFIDVMEAFYAVLENEKDEEALTTTHELLSKRLQELEGRIKLGRSRESESKTSLADSKLLESDLVNARSKTRVAKNLLEFYLGGSLEGVTLKDDPEEEPAPVKTLGAQRSKSRADVLADEQGLIVADKKVMAANADLFPTLSLDGDYYAERVGFQSGNDWDLKLKLDLPIFQVGQTMGDITQADSNRKKARLKYEETGRLADLDIRNASQALESARESELALQEAGKASHENYDILTEEYRSNLVNNLEVLDALRRDLDIQRRYHEAYYAARKSYWRLKVALGDVPGVAS